MSAFAITDRTGKKSIRVQHGLHCGSGEERNINRRKQKTVTFVLQIAKADTCGFKHLRMLIVRIPEKNQPHTGKMPLELHGVVAGNHDDPVHTGLLQCCNDALRDGDGADVQHRLEITHA